MRKVIVTGFGPLRDDLINPSLEIAEYLARHADGHQIVSVELPNRFAALREYTRTIVDGGPAVVLGLGVARTAATLEVERRAVNLAHTTPERPDDDGAAPSREPLLAGAPDYYSTTLPVDDIVARLGHQNIPAVASENAGTFLCNAALWWLRHHAAVRLAAGKSETRVGFIHVPRMPAQVAFDIRHGIDSNRASMPIELMVKGARLALHEALRQETPTERNGS